MGVDSSAVLHATAVVEDGATIGPRCRIGPYCTIGPDVVLGSGVTLHSHVSLAGRTRIGPDTTVWPFASLGHAPQDLKYAGEPTELVIGARNMIREHVTMSPGTAGGGGLTTVGDDGLYMMHAHVAHDCRVGNRVILANSVALGGHVIVEDGVIIGGLAAVHQFVRLGTGAMIGGLAGVVADVIPYGMVTGERGHLVGLNLVGLKRRNLERREIAALRAAFAEIEKGQGPFLERVRRAGAAHQGSALVQEVVRFVTADTARHFTVPPRQAAAEDG